MVTNGALSGKLALIRQIGSGSFGEVFMARYRQTQSLVALKVESKGGRSRVRHEYDIYSLLQKTLGDSVTPKVHEIIETPKFNMMSMELLGPCLGTVFAKHGKRFSLATVLELGIAILSLIEKIHKLGVVHRDIKPSNFLVGSGVGGHAIRVIDFGLAKQYVKKGTHIEFSRGKPLVGTARYASINVHLGVEYSRRDDLESLGYMIVYFALGELPWQRRKRRKDQTLNDSIGASKMSVSPSRLCTTLPDCFTMYLEHCRGIKFPEEPNYEYLRLALADARKQLAEKSEYNWS